MIELIQQRLDSYKASNPVAEEQATKRDPARACTLFIMARWIF